MTGMTAWHTEWLAKYAYTDEAERPAEFDVLLFDNDEDDLGDRPEVDEITTEPETGVYARYHGNFGDPLYTNVHDDYTAVRKRQPVDFDVTDTTEEVDAYAIVWEAVLERTLAEAWMDEQEEDDYEYEEWDDTYVFDAIQAWEEDPDFDPEAVDAEPFVMAVGELEERIDLTEYTGEFTTHIQLNVHPFF